MVCDMYTGKKFQVKPTALNTYFAFTDLGCLFLSYYFSSKSNSNYNNMPSQGTLLGNWATQLSKGRLSEFKLVVPPVQRPELAASELAWVWNLHGCVCLRLCIGLLRMSWHFLLSLLHRLSFLCYTHIAPSISTLQWHKLYKYFIWPRKLFFSQLSHHYSEQ